MTPVTVCLVKILLVVIIYIISAFGIKIEDMFIVEILSSWTESLLESN